MFYFYLISFERNFQESKQYGNDVITISIDYEQFQCHRELLMQHSEYFRGMFSGTFTENSHNHDNSTDNMTHVRLKSDINNFITIQSFSKFLQFVYQQSKPTLDSTYSQVPPTQSSIVCQTEDIDIFLESLALADYINSPGFKTSIETRLQQQVSPLTALKIFCYADQFRSEKLRLASLRMLRRSETIEIIPSLNEFHWLSDDQLIEILETNDDELQNLETIIRWTTEFPQNSQKLFDFIRPGLLTMPILKQIQLELPTSLNSR